MNNSTKDSQELIKGLGNKAVVEHYRSVYLC